MLFGSNFSGCCGGDLVCPLLLVDRCLKSLSTNSACWTLASKCFISCANFLASASDMVLPFAGGPDAK